MDLQPSKWVSAGRSSAGGAHRRRGDTRGDDVNLALAIRSGGYLVVADGAGSASRSARGAQVAVFAAMDWLVLNRLTATEPNAERLLRRCFAAAHRAVLQEAHASARSPGDYSTTLLVAVVSNHEVVAGQVGDGAIVVESAKGVRALLWDRASGPVNRTSFITDPRYHEALTITHSRETIRGVAAVTDGIEGLTVRRDGSVQENFYRNLLEYVRRRPAWGAGVGLDRLLNSRALRDHCDDDLTIAALARTEQQESHKDKDHDCTTKTEATHRRRVRKGSRVHRLPRKTHAAGRRRQNGSRRRGGCLPVRVKRRRKNPPQADGQVGREGGVGRREP